MAMNQGQQLIKAFKRRRIHEPMMNHDAAAGLRQIFEKFRQ
jgi:hypothetical protein